MKGTGNQMSTQKTPSLSLKETVNPLETPSDKLSECKKEVFHGVLAEVDDMFETIKEFLESKGIEFYRMQLEREAYQIKHDRQTIRFYVYREGPGG